MHARCLLPAVRCSLILHAHQSATCATRDGIPCVQRWCCMSLYEVCTYTVLSRQHPKPSTILSRGRSNSRRLWFQALLGPALNNLPPRISRRRRRRPWGRRNQQPSRGGGLAPVACRAGPCLPPRACACPRPPVRGWPSAFPVGNARESMGRNSASRVTVDCWGLSCPLHEPERHPRPKLAGSPYDYSYHPAYEAVICSSWTGEQRGLPAFWTGRSRCHR